MIETRLLPKSLSCLLSHDKQTGLWVNHCLDFDLVTSGTSEDQAWSAMKSILQSHVESCFQDGFVDGLSHKAGVDSWIAFAEHFMSGNFRHERLKFQLKKNSQPEAPDLWLKGVEVESFPTHLSATG